MAELFSQISLLEATAVVFALAYLILAIRLNRLCWIAAFIASVLSTFLFAGAQLYMQSALQVFYAAMAIYGWYRWTRGSAGEHEPARVHIWPIRNHVVALCGICVASILFAYFLSSTSQAMPLIDSFATVSAILTTWMVAHKLLENWIYWFVIDSVSIYLYLSQGLLLYAGLFVVYLVLVILGFRHWYADWRRQSEHPEPVAEMS